jgi:hypothetical protein
VSAEPNDPLTVLLSHGYGHLADHGGTRTLTLTFTPGQSEPLPDFQQRVQAHRRPADQMRVTVRNHKVALVELIRTV